MKTDTRSPCFVMESEKLYNNLAKLNFLERSTGVKILHTIKSFDSQDGVAIIGEYLSGFSIGNKNEYEKLKSIERGDIHSYAPYFAPTDIEDIAEYSDTLSFNSLAQYERYAKACVGATSLGIRINAQLTLKQPKYCNPNYTLRFGLPYQEFLKRFAQTPDLFDALEGLHFHVFCSQGLGGLKYLFAHIEKNYHTLLPRLQWLNLGGGHQLTDDSYESEGFISLVQAFRVKYPHLSIYFEPGESVVKDTGYLLTTIVDIIPTKKPIVILDTSIETHLLDLAITKIKPKIRGASQKRGAHLYQLAGMSCIAGDIIGDYYFSTELKRGDKIIFEDMMGYSIVKQTEFNGIAKAGFVLN